MFSRVLALLAVLLLSANTWAAIEINNHQARNMDDVQSLGVIYINHNFATESEARQALNEETDAQGATYGTVAKLAMRQPFVLFKGLTFQKLCLPGAFRPGDHHNKMLRPGLCVVHASPQYL